MKKHLSSFPTRPDSRASVPRRRPGLLLLVAVCLGWLPLGAAVTPLSGDYDSMGTVVETDTDYTGAVSFRALLGLDFDLAAGATAHPRITHVTIEQQERSFTISSKDASGVKEWSGTWKRNGGYEPTKEGVKLLIRAPYPANNLFMFTFTSMSEGGALLVEVQRIKSDHTGPVGEPVGKFLFLHAVPAG